MFNYEPAKVRNVIEEAESNSSALNVNELTVIQTIKDLLDADQEVPNGLLVKLSMIMRKVRR